ncbi:hypothetical protein V502_08252 [Pseudogymnoascus sp. VKM F-4520 (FW-2644)]|nr:hypothetical protein V502_08252 [Pseudogymnoascus sp. VKM F-4520 (FW-2644)]
MSTNADLDETGHPSGLANTEDRISTASKPKGPKGVDRMKISILITAAALALLPTTSAWRVYFYQLKDGEGPSITASGPGGTGAACHSTIPRPIPPPAAVSTCIKGPAVPAPTGAKIGATTGLPIPVTLGPIIRSALTVPTAIQFKVAGEKLQRDVCERGETEKRKAFVFEK